MKIDRLLERKHTADCKRVRPTRADQQIKTFVDSNTGYQFVNHQDNTDSGFSATVFKSNADGSYTFAVRGNEPPESGNED